MLSHDIRSKFLNYFKDKHHIILPSSSTIPHEDPTLLFTNAGMNQFKDLFLGKAKRDYSRAATSQKCIRVGGKHNDLDNVGHTSRHMTFFEMLGNFSFGDYFKEEAIAFAWEVTTEVFQFDPKRVWVSVFETDDEAYALWKKHIAKERIIRLGADENFWSMGETGPCGPCSELLYDRGEKFGDGNSPLEDRSGERFPEFWNLVFMESNRNPQGHLEALPKQSVDTGAGLERVATFLSGKKSVFECDTLRALIATIEAKAGKRYDPLDRHHAPAFHVIADHIRSLAFAIADGAQPSNIERGYILRKILRRAVRYGRLIGFEKPFLAEIFTTLVDIMGSDYQELKTAENQIKEILTLEEESFYQTLRRGGNILNTITQKAEESKRREISGEDAFKLKDTYGFPLEEILLIAKDHQLSVNLDAFSLLEEKARELSRNAQKGEHQLATRSLFDTFVKEHEETTFTGYNSLEGEGTIIGLVVGGAFVETMEAKQEGLVILDQTPFYPEKGGQIGDIGTLNNRRSHFDVTSCHSPYSELIVHEGILKEGVLSVGDPLSAFVDKERRSGACKHHTATHLLHWALQEVLGPHIRQAGSLVEAKRLRFDFNHHKTPTLEELRAIESLINEKIWEDRAVTSYILPLEEVQKHPEIKQFFGDKYGQKVRVVEIASLSKELCGGTHVRQLSSIGYFRIAKEGSIAKGVRRIEGLIGKEAETLRYEVEDQLLQVAETLKTPTQQLQDGLSSLLKENKCLKEELHALKQKQLHELALSLKQKVQVINNLSLLMTEVKLTKKELPLLASLLLEKIDCGVILLAIRDPDQSHLYLALSPQLTEQRLHAGKIIKELAPLIEGAGGGKAESAQAGGKKGEALPELFEALEKIVKSHPQ